MASKLKIIPLGGVGEVGKNMTVIEYGNNMIVVDCGLMFPSEEMLGIDLVIPDMTYLEKNAAKLRAIIITHGHEDHIGAMPFVLQKFKDVPVYGTRLALALINNKFKEHGIGGANLNTIAPGDTVKIGCFSIEFIKTTHSIAGTVALAIQTPVGTVLHTGDFKLDYTPADGEPMDLGRFAHFGKKGVLCLLSDSTNVERPGYTMSEQRIRDSLERYFDAAKGRVIVASFASNIYRVQQICDVAIEHGRKICFQGRSMVNIANIAMELGYLSVPEKMLADVDKLKKIDDDKICVITTGSQGEPMSGLVRMANASHKLNIGEGDMVILSASPIPGNEKLVARVINQLFKRGAEVVYDPMAEVHTSGHACQEELKLILQLTKPKYFIPVHGEYRHLKRHAMLAEALGVAKENIFVTEIGNVVEISSKEGGKINGFVPSGAVMVDGSGVGDIGNVVLKDRKVLSQDGLFVVIVTISKLNGALLAGPDIISRGFVYMRESESLIDDARELVKQEALGFEKASKSEWSGIKQRIKNVARDCLYERTKRNPMILPIIIEV